MAKEKLGFPLLERSLWFEQDEVSEIISQLNPISALEKEMDFEKINQGWFQNSIGWDKWKSEWRLIRIIEFVGNRKTLHLLIWKVRNCSRRLMLVSWLHWPLLSRNCEEFCNGCKCCYWKCSEKRLGQVGHLTLDRMQQLSPGNRHQERASQAHERTPKFLCSFFYWACYLCRLFCRKP